MSNPALTPIHAVYFGYSGVLSPGDSANDYLTTLNGHFDREMDKPYIAELNEQLQAAAISTDDYFAELSFRYRPYGEPYTESSYVAHSPSFKRNQQVYELAEKLRNKGFATGILANMPPIDRQLLPAQGGFEGFLPVVVSTDAGLLNPSTETVHAAQSLIGRNPENVLYVHSQVRMNYHGCTIDVIESRTGDMQSLGATTTAPERTVEDIVQRIWEQNELKI